MLNSRKKLKIIEKALVNNNSYTPELLEFWKGIVRDPNGNWVEYFYKKIKYFKYGKQPKPDLNNKKQLYFIKTAIEHEKAFLKGLERESYQNYKKWIIHLHKKQAYKGKGGDVLEEKRAGDHSHIVINSVLPLAKKYSDPYINEGKQILYLHGINKNGLPMDEWINKDKGLHYYPDPKYFDQYLLIMKKKLKKFILKKSKLPAKELISIIASYYQYGINMHMFKNVNQSLFANQANSMLKLMGLKSIRQGILDFTAMRLQPKNFIKYFIDEVKRENSFSNPPSYVKYETTPITI